MFIIIQFIAQKTYMVVTAHSVRLQDNDPEIG